MYLDFIFISIVYLLHRDHYKESARPSAVHRVCLRTADSSELAVGVRRRRRREMPLA